MRIKKCKFMQPRVELLGYFVDKDGVYVDEVKVEKIRKAHERDEDMAWGFEELKESLCTSPVLVHPNYEKPFIVSTDASSKAVGAVLYQLDEKDHEHPIHYASRNLNDAENNYSAFEREALGIVFALKKFHNYLLCQRLKLYTEHQALKYGINLRDSHGRMSLFAEFDFEIVYRPGDKNTNTEYLSRLVEDEKVLLERDIGLGQDLEKVYSYLSTGKVRITF